VIVACVSSLALPAVIVCALCSSTLGNVLMNRWLDRRRNRLVPRGEYVPTPAITVSPAYPEGPDDLRPYVGGPPVAPAGWSRPTAEPAPGTRPTGSPRRERSDIVPLEYDRYR
jgi:hypothetical protein